MLYSNDFISNDKICIILFWSHIWTTVDQDHGFRVTPILHCNMIIVSSSFYGNKRKSHKKHKATFSNNSFSVWAIGTRQRVTFTWTPRCTVTLCPQNAVRSCLVNGVFQSQVQPENLLIYAINYTRCCLQQWVIVFSLWTAYILSWQNLEISHENVLKF